MPTPPTYEVKPVAEGTWAGVCVATGGLTGAILLASGVDQNVTVAASTLVAAVTRFVGGVIVAYAARRWPPPP